MLCAGLLCSCARAFIVLANPRVGASAREGGMEDWQRQKVVYGPSREGRIWCGQEMSGNAWWSYSPPNSRKEYETRHILSAHLGRADRPNIRSRPNVALCNLQSPTTAHAAPGANGRPHHARRPASALISWPRGGARVTVDVNPSSLPAEPRGGAQGPGPP